jgi:hypothetical protein
LDRGGCGAALHLCENPEEILNALKECELDEDGLDNFLENIRGKHIALQAIREEVERTRTLSLTFLQHQLEAWVSQAEDRAETDHTLPQSRPDQGTVDELRKQGCCPEMTGRYRWPIRDGP